MAVSMGQYIFYFYAVRGAGHRDTLLEGNKKEICIGMGTYAYIQRSPFAKTSFG